MERTIRERFISTLQSRDIYTTKGDVLPSEILMVKYRYQMDDIINLLERINNNAIIYTKSDKANGVYSDDIGMGYYKIPRCEFLLHSVKTIEDQLLDWFKENKYNQGDNYNCYINKFGKWVVSYTNDYPMQHGDGKRHTFTDAEFFDATDKIRIKDRKLLKAIK